MKILNTAESLKALPQCHNAGSADLASIKLPDGHKNALRVGVAHNKKRGQDRYYICAPWLLSGIF